MATVIKIKHIETLALSRVSSNGIEATLKIIISDTSGDIVELHLSAKRIALLKKLNPTEQPIL